MKLEYKVQCEHCDKETSFAVHEVDCLDDDIEDEIEAAKDDVRDEYAGMVYPDDVQPDHRQLEALSAAIRAGDRAEAEYLLDRIAAEFGSKATEYVQRGRYSLRRAA